MVVPNENLALNALQKVQALSGEELDALITSEIGNPMLGVFRLLAEAMIPGGAKEQLNQAVHLMVLSYLMRGFVEQ